MVPGTPSASLPTDAPPRQALGGRYLLLDLVGIGGMGSVWRAWDLHLEDVVAVKMLHRLDAAYLHRFVREQGLRIDHPHLASPTGWVADDERAAYAMALLSGGSVGDLLGDHGPLPVATVAVLLDQLLDGLTAVHDAGVVHRDLKPANLLLAATGGGRPHLRLADFGVAAAVAGPRFTTVPGGVGTPGYAAPEQLAGAPPCPRQDLYAVGVLGRVLLGREPLGSPETPDGPLTGLLHRLCRPDPDDRPASAREARALLAACGPFEPAPWPHVPDRLGPVTVPVPGTYRPTGDPSSTARSTAGQGPDAALLGALVCFVASLALSAAAGWLLLAG